MVLLSILLRFGFGKGVYEESVGSFVGLGANVRALELGLVGGTYLLAPLPYLPFYRTYEH